MFSWFFGANKKFVKRQQWKLKIIIPSVENLPRTASQGKLKFGFFEKATKFEKIFVVLLTRASCSVRATAYLSKIRRRFFKTNVVKLYYTNFTPFINFKKAQAVLLLIVNWYFRLSKMALYWNDDVNWSMEFVHRSTISRDIVELRGNSIGQVTMRCVLQSVLSFCYLK